MSSSQPLADPGSEPDTTAGGPVNTAGAGSGPPSPHTPGSAPDHRYLLDNARVEAGERFTWLAELFDGVTRGHFDRLGGKAGSRCSEVGACGPSLPQALAPDVRPTRFVPATGN